MEKSTIDITLSEDFGKQLERIAEKKEMTRKELLEYFFNACIVLAEKRPEFLEQQFDL